MDEERIEKLEILEAYLGLDWVKLAKETKDGKYGPTMLEMILGAMDEYAINKVAENK